MTSERQVIANQNNALKSTGPKTVEGRAVVSKNAVKHGILSKEVFVDEGMEESFVGFRDNFYNEFDPRGQLEHLLLDRIVSCAWRLALVNRVEAQIYAKEDTGWEKDQRIRRAFLSYTRDGMSLICRYESAMERSFYRALLELKRVQNARREIEENLTTTIENGFVS